MSKLPGIMYENGNFWVRRNEHETFEVYKVIGTHSVRCAQIGYKGAEGLQRAMAECNKRALAEGKTKDETDNDNQNTRTDGGTCNKLAEPY